MIINTLALKIALTVGVPTGILLAHKLEQYKEEYKYKMKCRSIEKDLNNVFAAEQINATIMNVFTTNNGFMVDIISSSPIYKISFIKDKLIAQFGLVEIEIIREIDSSIVRLNCYSEIIDTTEHYKYVPLPTTTILCGYGDIGYLTVDMLKCPHMLITGLSGQGKTGMIKVILNNLRGADIVLLNGFDDDFEDFKYIRRVKGESDIYKYLLTVYENLYKRERPLYLVIEELATIKDKKLNDIIKELLCVARHYNIFIIGIIQIATKEELKFKSYFNARCSFKQLDDSAYRVALGCGVDGALSKREFYLFTDSLYKGMTFTL